MASPQSYANLVQELYIAYFGRPADFNGLINFETALIAAKGPTDAAGLYADYSSSTAYKSLIDAFGNSSESATLYASTTTEGFVNAVFENLFNRSAANAGLEFWAAAIDAGTVTRSEAALAIAAGAENNTSAQGLLDAQSVANKVACANAFLSDWANDGLASTDYAGAQMAGLGRAMIAGVGSSTTAAQYDAVAQALVNTFGADTIVPVQAFTTGVDTFVGNGGYNIFDGILDNAAGLAAGGQAQTFNTGDSVTGAGVSDTLNLTDFGLGGTMSVPAGIKVSGITSILINSLEGVSGDFSTWETGGYFGVVSSNGDDNVKVNADATVNVSDKSGNVTIQGGGNITANTDAAHTVSISSSAAGFQATVGDSASNIIDAAVGAAIKISAGAGADNVTLGANASGSVAFAAHTGADSIVLGASGASLTGFIIVSGLNNAGSDTITFAGETASTLSGFKQVTSAEVAATGANPALLQSWIAAADGAAGSGMTGGAHSVTWFQYQGQTFVLESVAGQSADAGTMAAGNTVVELTGTGYSFAHATGANGSLHLLG